jgi:hypothetical protein
MKPPSYDFHPRRQPVAHFQEPSVQLDALVDSYRNSTVGFRRWCWAGVSGETLEDIWNSHINCTMSIFGPVLPLFVPWNRQCGHPANHSTYYDHTLMDSWFFLQTDFI